MSNQLDFVKAVLYNFLNMFSLYTAAFVFESAKLVFLITGGGAGG